MTKFYKFSQNNSGGSFDIDDLAGIGPRVWIEATDADHANEIAETIGIYFDGVDDDRDCPCCGDRWHRVDDYDASDRITLSPEYDFNWHPVVYVHRLDGPIERLRKGTS